MKEEFETEAFPLKKKTLLLLQAQRKEKGSGSPIRKTTKEISKEMRNLTCQRSSVSVATRWDIMQETTTVGKESKDSMHLLLILMKNLRIREQGNPTMNSQPDKRRSRSFSSPLLQVPSPTVRKLGWWTVGLPNT